MTKEQIAHDLAVAKLNNSELQTKELIAKYREYYDDILSELDSKPAKPQKAVIMNNFI